MKPAFVLTALLACVAACTPPLAHLPQAPSYLYRRAEDAFARSDYQAAVVSYQQFLSGKPEPAFVPRAYYQLALAQYHLHQYSTTLDTLDELKQHAPDRNWVQAQALRGDAQFALGQRVAALLAWADAWQLASPPEQARLRARIEPLASQLGSDEKAEASQAVLVPAVRELAGLGDLMAAVPIPPSEIAPASAEASTAPPAPEPPPAEAAAVVEVAEAHPAPAVFEPVADAPEPEPAESTKKVACLLPLTGPDHAYGQRALAGLRLAFTDAPEQLVVRDTGGDPANSGSLLRALAADPTVVAVVGPLRSSEAEVTAPLAERDQLPLLLLSQREGLAGRSVFQVAMMRTQQVELLIKYSAETLHLRQFGVVYPNDGYGSAFTTAFRNAAVQHGAQVVGTQAYEPGATDFASAIAAVRRWHASGLQALFIPDAAATAAALATRVRVELPDLALLGTESWNDAAVLSQAGSSINGAIFTDAFFVNSARPSTREFVERFQQGAGRPPTVFEAQAFDAGMALRHAIANGATSRSQVLAELSNLGSFEAAGELRSSPSGFQRALSVLRYRDGIVEEVVPDNS